MASLFNKIRKRKLVIGMILVFILLLPLVACSSISWIWDYHNDRSPIGRNEVGTVWVCEETDAKIIVESNKPSRLLVQRTEGTVEYEVDTIANSDRIDISYQQTAVLYGTWDRCILTSDSFTLKIDGYIDDIWNNQFDKLHFHRAGESDG